MRLSVRLTGTTLRLTGSRAPWSRPTPAGTGAFLMTEGGELLATETGDQLLAEPSDGQ